MDIARSKKIKGFVLDGLLFFLGSLIYALAINTFTAPNNRSRWAYRRCDNA